MKLLSFAVAGYLAIASFFNGGVASSSSSDPFPEFTKAGFSIKPLKGLTAQEATEFTAELTKFCGGTTIANNILVVTDYPKAASKTAVNYAPPRSIQDGTDKLVLFDTIVMSRYFDPLLGGTSSGESQLPKILESWVATGFSCHVFLPTNGGIIFWVDPTKSKGQMAGPFNAHALEVLAGTEAPQALQAPQIDALGFLLAFSKARGEKIEFLLSHGEARGSEHEGTITNIGKARGLLGLKNDNKVKDQVLPPME